MGYGTYSVVDRDSRATTLGYYTKSSTEIFSSKSINNAMSPYGITVRESRDSAEHPNTVAIILALDVTGSMGSIPHFLVKEGLPAIMGSIIEKGIKDPQLLFLGIGDHECDDAPLQVGQFESNDELLDKWLTDVYLEGGGGGNGGESYLLAWYLAGYHTSIDCIEKRGQKGFLFTVGDEPVLPSIPKKVLSNLMGDGQYENFLSSVLLDRAREMYNVYHLHIKQTASGSRQHVIDGWKQLMGDNLIVVEKREDVAQIIVDVLLRGTPKEKSRKGEETTEIIL